MSMRYGICEDYEQSAGRKRHYMTVWSGGFMSDFEGWAVSLPNGDGYMVTGPYGSKVRVSCPCPRNDDNFEEVDAAINAALSERWT